MKFWMDKLLVFCATGFGAGYMRFAPGTFGTLAGFILIWIFPKFSSLFEIGMLLVFIWLACFSSERAEKIFGKKDDQRIVIDEVVGYWVSVALLPKSFPILIVGFVLFRLFDILKPYPVRQLGDRLPGGYGIVMDDVGAGVYANLLLHLMF